MVARPSPLIDPASLAASMSDPTLRIADVRWYLGKPGEGRIAYDAGHLPGAIFVDVDTVLTAPDGPGRHPLPTPSAFLEALGRLGIGSSHRVVAYDDVGGWVAARLWWMLDDIGHAEVAVLDGGYPAWVAAGLPVTTDEPSIDPAPWAAAPKDWRRVVDRAGVKAQLGSATLLDARGGPRYRGEVEPIDAVPGHIPTARHAPTDANLDPDGRFLAAPDLRDRLGALAGNGDGPVITSCGSGISACHNALAMRVAGLPDPILYPGSYSDWTQAGEPVATGADPGDPPG
jgi:thiosulfate/3-mercaptopyruvate sulfurtransferase